MSSHTMRVREPLFVFKQGRDSTYESTEEHLPEPESDGYDGPLSPLTLMWNSLGLPWKLGIENLG